VSDKLNEMWAALEAHKPTPEYAEAWATMLKERTAVVMRTAARAAEDAGVAGAAGAAWAAAWAYHFAQRAINAIEEVKP
jgi:hypothetical protein